MTPTAPRPTPRRGDIAVGTDGGEATLPHDLTQFAHNSERQFAKLLDFYQIDWEYEPTTFDIEWDRGGTPTQRFSPDFYLPDFDLYIEITTLNQKLVTKKNRKVRRLMALYPDVRCKVLYQRDYLNLLVKYGLEHPSQVADDGNDDARVETDAPRAGTGAGEAAHGDSALGSVLAG